MQRSQLEAALRATAEATKESELVLVGSQSVHAHTAEPPVEVLVSEECDIFVKGKSDRLDTITPALGRNSSFHRDHGFFVDPVDPGLLLLPPGWESRLKPLLFGSITAWCLDVADLAISKLNAGRLKDYEFVSSILRTRLAQFDEVTRRIQTFSDPHQQAVLLARLRICSESIS